MTYFIIDNMNTLANFTSNYAKEMALGSFRDGEDGGRNSVGFVDSSNIFSMNDVLVC